MFADKRYLRVHNRPVLLVYCPGAIPDPRRWADAWRNEAQRIASTDLYLALVQSVNEGVSDPRARGFDAAVEFPPHWLRAHDMTPHVQQRRPGFRGGVLDYISCAQDALARQRPAYTLFRGVMPGWDNTARGQDLANVFVNAEPANYERWLREAIRITRQWHAGDERLVFINAWNE